MPAGGVFIFRRAPSPWSSGEKKLCKNDLKPPCLRASLSTHADAPEISLIPTIPLILLGSSNGCL